jgi:eukaryotic-like serine/threonine-protein kinase
MGTVYLARDEELRREVALKVLAEHVAQNDEMRSRFLRKARLAARLSHPNIVHVFDVGETADGLPFIVMEYVPGETLAQQGKVTEAGTILGTAAYLAPEQALGD